VVAVSQASVGMLRPYTIRALKKKVRNGSIDTRRASQSIRPRLILKKLITDRYILVIDLGIKRSLLAYRIV
jgi:hypothetical protein